MSAAKPGASSAVTRQICRQRIACRLVMLASALVCSSWLSGCGTDGDAADDPEIAIKSAEVAAIEVEGFTMTVTKDGELVSNVKAEGGWMPSDHRQISLYDVMVREYSNDIETGTIQADEGTLYLRDIEKDGIKRNDAFLWGNVSVKRADGLELSMSEATYEGSQGKLSSDKHTEIAFQQGTGKTQPTIVFSGESFEMTEGDSIDGKQVTHIKIKGRGGKRAVIEFKSPKPEERDGEEG